MNSKKTVAPVEAQHGEKMIEVKIRFWTNAIAAEDGKIIPKNAWTNGVVRIQSNKAHGIVAQKPRMFHTLLGIGAAIEKVLTEHEVVLHQSRNMQKYMAEK